MRNEEAAFHIAIGAGRLNTQRTPKSSQNTPRIRLSRKHAKYAANRPEPGRIDGPKSSQNTPRIRLSIKYAKYAANPALAPAFNTFLVLNDSPVIPP
jgi:hypothetical protein